MKRQFVKIFVINLKKSKQRREYIENHFKKYKIDFEFFEAVDGRALSDEYVESIFDKQTAERTWKDMNRGEIGCALSHLGVYKKMINENISQAIIFEDDIFINDDFCNLLSIHNQWLKPDMEVVLFGYGCNFKHPWQFLKNIPNTEYKTGKVYQIASLACAYYINLSGCNKILAKNQPKIIRAIDDITGDAIYGGHNLYGIYPPVVGVRPGKSDIGYHDDKNIFNGSLMIPPSRFLAINFGWSEKFAICFDKILRLVLLFPLWEVFARKIAEKYKQQNKKH